MSPSDSAAKLPRKKPSAWWWIGGAVVLFLAWFLYQLFGPSPAIIISKETTYITAPLRPDGLPDYEKYVLELYRDGVTPENNAAVLLWQAMWPGDLEPEQYAVVAKELGLSHIPSAHNALVPPYREVTRERVAKWLNERAGLGAGAANGESAAGGEVTDGEARPENGYDPSVEHVDLVIDQAMSRPWTSEQIPPLGKWIEENQKAIDWIVEASQRPRYYSPSPTLLNQERNMLIAILLPDIQSSREAARALHTRAMWHLGEGRLEVAWQELLATHRLARLVGQGPSLVGQLVAIAIDGMACDATRTMLGDERLTAELAVRILGDLGNLPSLYNSADAIEQFERVMALDAVIHFKTFGVKESMDILTGSSRVGPRASSIGSLTIDWNIVLSNTNDWYDRLVAAARLPTRPQRQAAFAVLDDEMAQMGGNAGGTALLGAYFNRGQRSELIGNVVAALMLPALGAATNAEDRGQTMLELTRLAAALAVYRAKHGQHPDSLDDLVPGVLDELPVDVYNAKSFVYKRDGEGYLLYSAGPNGNDDGGNNAQMQVFEGRSQEDMTSDEWEGIWNKITPDADDYSIRLPRPALKLPEPPPAGAIPVSR
jgi:hypothetical protein